MASNRRVDSKTDDEVCRPLQVSEECTISSYADVTATRRDWKPVLNNEFLEYFSELKDVLDAGIFRMNRLRRIMTEKVNAETAEQFVSGFINENEPWLLKVLEDYKSSMFHIADLTVPTIDDDYEEDNTDARSFTIPLAMEASPTTARFEPIFNMGPPPSRAGGCAPEAPMTLATPSVIEMTNGGGPSDTRRDDELTASRDDAGYTGGQRTNGKRPLNGSSAEEPGPASGPSSKRPKNSAQAASPSNTALAQATNALDFFEVDGEDYAFADQRCGPGWYVVRCNLSKQTGINDAVRFTQHPFEDDTALKHFNDKRRRCHEPKSRYTEEDIIRGFACRVYWNARAQEEASDDDFIKSNESVKKKRQIADAAKGSAKKPGRGRGKKKSGEIGPQSGQAHDGSSGEDMEGSYREE